MEFALTLVPGSYVCVDIGGFVGKCIKTLTRSDADHAFVILDTDGTIFESQPNKIHGHSGAHINNISEYAGMDMWQSDDHIPLPPAELRLAADQYLGTRYGFLDILLLGVQTTLHWTPWPLSKLVQDENRMICSQLVSHFGGQNGIDWTCGVTCDQYVTPGMLKARGTSTLLL